MRHMIADRRFCEPRPSLWDFHCQGNCQHLSLYLDHDVHLDLGFGTSQYVLGCTESTNDSCTEHLFDAKSKKEIQFRLRF